MPAGCVFCDSAGGQVLWQDAQCRVVLADEPDFPGFCRVVWHAHIAEMSDLPEQQRLHLMRVVFAVENALRQALRPDKINLASLGNVTPHLHWHVIPRYRTDRSFPDPVWNPPRRVGQLAISVDSSRLQAALERLLGGPEPA